MRESSLLHLQVCLDCSEPLPLLMRCAKIGYLLVHISCRYLEVWFLATALRHCRGLGCCFWMMAPPFLICWPLGPTHSTTLRARVMLRVSVGCQVLHILTWLTSMFLTFRMVAGGVCKYFLLWSAMPFSFVMAGGGLSVCCFIVVLALALWLVDYCCCCRRWLPDTDEQDLCALELLRPMPTCSFELDLG